MNTFALHTKKAFWGILGVSLFWLPAMAASGHGDSRVMIQLESPAQISAGKNQIQFQLHDMDNNIFLSPSQLNITHEKVLHFLAYDPSLNEFRHVHPEFDGQKWFVDLDLPVNGKYFIWAQGEISSDSTEFSAVERLEVVNGAPALPAPALSDVRSAEDSGSVATLSSTKLKAGKMAMLTLVFTKTDGAPANITPYLGAFAHVIATPEDGSSLTHVHPMDGSVPNEGMLHVTFPTAGNYRLWVQFIDDGTLKTVPLSVEVK